MQGPFTSQPSAPQPGAGSAPAQPAPVRNSPRPRPPAAGSSSREGGRSGAESSSVSSADTMRDTTLYTDSWIWSLPRARGRPPCARHVLRRLRLLAVSHSCRSSSRATGR
jgi:hypothetical protein